MDGYEDLPILLSVIQSNKVNIYCIYIKNYPGIEWRRLAFIGVFPGVKPPRMRARGEERSARARIPNLFKPLHPSLRPPRGVPPPSLCPLGGGRGGRERAGCRLPRGRGQPSCRQSRGQERRHSPKYRPEEIWGVIEEKEAGGGDSFPLSSVWLHHFLIRHKIVFIHWYCGLHKQSLWFIRPPLWGGLLKIERTGAGEAWSPGGPALSPLGEDGWPVSRR